MSTSTDASTVIGEARPAGDGTSTEAGEALDAAAVTDEGTAVVTDTVTGELPPVAADTRAEERGAAEEHGATDASPAAGDAPAAGGATAVDDAAPADEAVPPDDPPASWLRIERGHAEPEEIAAISVVLCAQLAGLRALAEPGHTEEPSAARRPHARHTACWSGCWSCG
ncbi:acyl-CoA carboxylase epsilon subunit [Streptomyces lydicus]|uniref:acyl-CoA carboxylase epsilon subunit n=1 Tax=Streptomyces lydicus TaxID=47763 RepID=UPI0013E944D4|nr:acyl-CoA carboxylase epsilon subunit [Streptomyces lydicus]